MKNIEILPYVIYGMLSIAVFLIVYIIYKSRQDNKRYDTDAPMKKPRTTEWSHSTRYTDDDIVNVNMNMDEFTYTSSTIYKHPVEKVEKKKRNFPTKAELEKELERLVEEEKYEEAAKVRDKINKIKTK